MSLETWANTYCVDPIPVRGELTGAKTSGSPACICSSANLPNGIGTGQELVIGLAEFTGLTSTFNLKLYYKSAVASYTLLKEYLNVTRGDGILSDLCRIEIPNIAYDNKLYLACDFTGTYSYYLMVGAAATGTKI
jgi:hypothetical protein